MTGIFSQRSEIVKKQEIGGGMCECAGDEIMVGAEEGNAVERRAGEVVGYFAAEFAG